MSMLSKAIDKVRAEEVKKLEADGYDPVLKRSRWLLLKRPENLTEKQSITLSSLLEYNLKGASNPTCSRNSSSSFGNILTPPARANSWTRGAEKSCAQRSSP